MVSKRNMVREVAAATYEARVDPNGRIVLPAAVRRQLGVAPGDQVVLHVEKDGVRVSSIAAAVRDAQATVRRHLRPGTKLVDELLAWRRSEVGRE
jgi:AbrB family looped-hinge helix DNA binding protein